MAYGAKDIAAAFRTVRNNTIQIANDIPEDKYGFKPSPESRSIGQTLAWSFDSTYIASHVETVLWLLEAA